MVGKQMINIMKKITVNKKGETTLPGLTAELEKLMKESGVSLNELIEGVKDERLKNSLPFKL